MSFASDVRGELARLRTDDICCARSELTAALLVSGLYARQPTQRGANGRMVQNAAFTGTLALIAAQQAAMCASIAATSAASS